MITKTRLYLSTLLHLKPIQIGYRIWYPLRNTLLKMAGSHPRLSISRPGTPLNLVGSIRETPSLEGNSFTFLNQSHHFQGEIDWNLNSYGRLWTYHLNYFQFLHQEEMTKDRGLELILGYIGRLKRGSIGLEPYPSSLRGINWIKFISRHGIQDERVDASLYGQYEHLMNNLEYHILGNHLLENGCSLLFAAFYFRNRRYWDRARQILSAEMEEQILEDGGHYERSVAYHCVVYQRLLDCYNLLGSNSVFDRQEELTASVHEKVRKMGGWLSQMKWENGELPEVNDHIAEMLPAVPELEAYARRLKAPPEVLPLGESGYRKYEGEGYEVLVDAGDIGPDYVPGHAHSDTFSFLLRIDGREVITDTGTSTYENTSRRHEERSTAAHNTVMVEETEQNEMWSSFRVGRRGHVTLLVDKEDEIKASHDAYCFMKVTHERHFKFSRREITIHDRLISDSRDIRGDFFLNFPPGLSVKLEDHLLRGELFSITFPEAGGIRERSYRKATGYHQTKAAPAVAVAFTKSLTTVIRVHP